MTNQISNINLETLQTKLDNLISLYLNGITQGDVEPLLSISAELNCVVMQCQQSERKWNLSIPLSKKLGHHYRSEKLKRCAISLIHPKIMYHNKSRENLLNLYMITGFNIEDLKIFHTYLYYSYLLFCIKEKSKEKKQLLLKDFILNYNYCGKSAVFTKIFFRSIYYSKIFTKNEKIVLIEDIVAMPQWPTLFNISNDISACIANYFLLSASLYRKILKGFPHIISLHTDLNLFIDFIANQIISFSFTTKGPIYREDNIVKYLDFISQEIRNLSWSEYMKVLEKLQQYTKNKDYIETSLYREQINFLEFLTIQWVKNNLYHNIDKIENNSLKIDKILPNKV